VKSHTVYRTFETAERREFVRITEDVQAAVDEAGIAEGMVLVSAMHITAGVWVNDDEPGLQADTLEWLDKLAPPSWKEPANDVARDLSPDPGDYRHHAGGEDNGDAHLKNLLVHHQVIVPVTEGRLDLGPWQAIFYTDQSAVYAGVLPPTRHRALSKLARLTNHVERFHCTLRQRVSRLVRSTLSFSKKLTNHVGAIRHFLCHYTLTRSAALPE